MKIKTFLVLVILASLIFISRKTIFSEEAIVQGGAIAEEEGELETLWLWGEVVNLDPQNKIFLVKYLDYETDQEKEINIKTDDLTAYENSGSIDQIKPKDTLSIDYIVSASGENIAKNISVEKPEDTQGTQEGDIMEEGQITEGQKAAGATEEKSEMPGY